jgi:hypothetical protein
VGEGLDGLLADMVAFEADTEAATNLIRAAAQEMQDRAAQERSGVQSSSKVDLSLYRDPIIAKNISSSDFCLNDLMNGDRPVSLYLFPPKNLFGLVLSGFWFSGWLYLFVREQRSAGKFLLSSAPPQAPRTGDPP